ncbi:uncharacterized protein M421DRAFT_422176 [Didymella exigua CBS 183.55]|uniref:Ecp2 effector protein domain-containing protein n=1 Tax=Didymella exigua CBS 183.55 TaxID=1150837 RepID=A0A6A5RI69_9PLEO|nr:uncharacterized protein M421DRAFT_422176 [Didymella exigua CBS 183.55]KAF1926940.1 hypothetical protein M421DRAFT_422176 [Didymella exigua CBS 183.55]
MHLTVLTILSLSALASARPTAAVLASDARAATIFKSANTKGESTFIPANNYCTNISVVPGGFDGKIKSVSVEKDRKCDFYQEEGCGVNDFTGGGAVLEVGSRKYKDVRRRLGRWEGRIASVYCQKL